MDRGELRAEFQPQLRVGSDQVVAVEALARWHHPEFGTIPPQIFIPIAERIGAINRLGDFMLDESCRRAARWAAQGTPLEISVNISPSQLNSETFADRTIEIVEEHDLPAAAVTLEITETSPIVDLARSVQVLERLRAVGIGVSVDDFGTGYSTLDQVRSLPATELKLDRSLVQAGVPAANAVVRSVVDEARMLGLRVVAEGVETFEQLQRVEAWGCDRAQGYWIGWPMSAETLEASLAGWDAQTGT